MTKPVGKPKLVIFDCDGVLVDSEVLSIQVLMDTLGGLGLPVTAEQCYELFLGRSFASLKRTLIDRFDHALTDDQIEIMRLQLADLYRQQLQPINGIAQALQQIRVPYCVASSSYPERIRLSLDLTGLSGYFGDHVFSASMVVNGKPAPDLFLYAADRMTTQATDCLVVEDSPAGIQAAHAASMRAFAFVGGSHAAPAGLRATVTPYAPSAIFDRMQDLPGLIEALAIG